MNIQIFNSFIQQLLDGICHLFNLNKEKIIIKCLDAKMNNLKNINLLKF
jgi:hypothetical protein